MAGELLFSFEDFQNYLEATEDLAPTQARAAAQRTLDQVLQRTSIPLLSCVGCKEVNGDCRCPAKGMATPRGWLYHLASPKGWKVRMGMLGLLQGESLGQVSAQARARLLGWQEWWLQSQ